MSFRRKLLLLFALTVGLSVAAVTWTVSVITRRAFEHLDVERSAALVAQFQREFQRRGQQVVQKVENIATSDATTRMALSLSHGSPDYGTYLTEARTIAENQQLDFLEFVDSQGNIISSAQSPAKFGYKETSLPNPEFKDAFLRQEDLPEGAALGLCAIRLGNVGDTALYVIGGQRIDRGFLASLELPAGMRAMFYQNLGSGFSPQLLIDPAGDGHSPDRLSALIQQVEQQHSDKTEIIPWTVNPTDDESIHAIPLTGQDQRVLGVLLVATSRRPYVELRQRIRSAALLVGGGGIILAVLLSGWVAARVTRPVEQLAAAARQVASGDWNTQVDVTSSDELGELAETFNRMTHDLLEQKERLVQTERIAIWRELARRLAHELKNPLFPLQLTVENLVRAHQQGREQFEEVFRESAATLLAEISNLKGIVSRFSEFSRMPAPQFQSVQLNEVVRNVVRLVQAQLRLPERPPVETRTEFADLPSIAADPELLYRAVSNLVLNAAEAMPQGGALTLRTRSSGNSVTLEVADTGSGLTSEECQHLFTPYYTSKAQGTGLGLAIVQSVVSDHHGRISVHSEPGRGTTFIVELPVKQENTKNIGGSSGAAESTFADRG